MSTDDDGRQVECFRWEKDMTPVVEACIDSFLPAGQQPDAVVAEVPAAIGVVDLLAVTFDAEAIETRQARQVGPICSGKRVQILDALGKPRWRRVETIARRIGSTPEALTRSTLRPLAELDLIELDGPRLRSTGRWSPLGTRITAIELKLSRWQRALRQADNFALSTDRAWVVLDRHRIDSASRHLEWFKATGVGLAAVDTAGTTTIVTAPGHRRRPVRWLRSLIAERAWAGWQTGSSV